MDLLEFRQEWLAQVRTQAAADADFLHTAFVTHSAEQLEDFEEISDFEVCYFRGADKKRRALAIDGFSFDDADDCVRLVIASVHGDDDALRLTQTAARQLFQRAVAFLEAALADQIDTPVDESTPVFALAALLRHRFSSLSRVRFYLVTDDILSERVKDWPEGELRGVPTEFHIWDASRFHRTRLSLSGRDELLVDFAEYCPGGISCLPASVTSSTYRSYLAVIPGSVLADVYDRHGSRLLEGNVRAFLSSSGKINKGIRTTILSERPMFFAYNNGISATATEVEVEQAADGLRLLRAKDFQIVNGGQTTASLSFTRRKDGAPLDGIFLQMKISQVDADSAGSVIPLISRFANFQNRVSEADFFSNHEFHRRIEEISRRLRAPATAGAQVETFWFYERARGQYTVELSKRGVAQRRVFETDHPRTQVFSKTDLAKSENAWKRLPHEVSKGAQKNFLVFAEATSAEWETNKDEFSDEYFKTLVARIILWRRLELLIPQQEWYQGGYRANIVAYTISKISSMLEEIPGRPGLNVGRIWREQRISTVLEASVLRIAAKMAEIVSSPEAGVQNVTEWCKKVLCWQRAQALPVAFDDEVRSELVERADERDRLRNGRQGARIAAGVEAMTRVLAVPAEEWSEIRSWASERRLSTPPEDRLLARLFAGRWRPNEREAEAVLVLIQRLREEGFAPSHGPAA